MTYLEAFKQGLREIGVPEAEIDKRLTRLMMLAPMPVNPHEQMPKGTERRLIEFVKMTALDFVRSLKENPDEALAKVKQTVAKRLKAN